MAGERERRDLFGIVVEIPGRAKPLVCLDSTFGRLIDEVVVPYDLDQPFFVDGVTVTKNTLERIKIVRLGSASRSGLSELDRGMTRSDPQNRKTYGDQYNTRFEHVLRVDSEDVTAQVLKAFQQAVKPKISG